MTNHSTLSNDSVAATGETERAEGGRGALLPLKGPIQFTCFWLAVALPFVYLPLLVVGLGSATVLMAFLALLGLNVATLYVGRGYNLES